MRMISGRARTSITAIASRRFRPYIYFLALAWINVYVCREAFFRPATGHFNSMHGEWMALARLGNFVSWSPKWWPWWGAGVPLEYTYAPLVPVLTAFGKWLEHVGYDVSFNQLTALTYCALPLTLYVVSWRLSGYAERSFIAGLACSLISPISAILPDTARWNSFGDARRLSLLFEWDDLPHVVSLTLVPIVVWSLFRALQTRRWRFYWIATLTMSGMMLANMFGVVLSALVAITVPWTADVGTRVRKFFNSGIVLACAYVLACPWLPPSLILTIRTNGIRNGEASGPAKTAIALLVIIAVTVVFRWVGRRWIRNWGFRWLLVTGSVLLAIPILDAHSGWHFVPQPGRYKIEADLAMIWLAVFAAGAVIRKAPLWVRGFLAIALIAVSATQVVRYRRYWKALMQPVDTKESIEYRAAEWAAEHEPDERVFLTGSMGQWADTFVNVPQLSGQPYTTTPNFNEYLAMYILYSDDGAGNQGAGISLEWLKAFGAQSVAVPGRESPEYWKPFVHPRKFDGLLPLQWHERDTSAYDLDAGAPADSAIRSLAHVVRVENLVRHSPVNGVDVDGMRAYVAAIQNPDAAPARLRWNDAEHISVDTQLQAGDVVSIQINYAKGWDATVNGQAATVRPDGLGLIVVESTCVGPCRVQLDYKGSPELRACRIASLGFTVLALVLGALHAVKKRGSDYLRPASMASTRF